MNALKSRISSFVSRAVFANLMLMSFHLMAADFAVSPMLIELSAERREVKEFSFTVFGKGNADIKLELFNLNQLESGYMGFTKLEVGDMNWMGSWVELERDKFRLRDGETMTVHGIIKIPSRAAGTHLVAIMVEEDIPEKDQGGISVKIRYAVVINLRVDGKYSRIKTQFGELAVVHTEDRSFLEAYFLNESATDNWLFTEVQIRDENRRLLERVPLKTESAWQRADVGSRVFPGARVRLYGEITESFDTGTYNVLVRNKFADKSQSVYRDTIYLEAPQQQAALLVEGEGVSVDMGTVAIDPEALQISIRDNGTSFSTFFITNTKNEKVIITLPSFLEDLEEHGVSEFNFYPEVLSIRPNRKSRVVLRQTHISDSDYGDIVFSAKIESETGTDEDSVLAIRTVGGA